ncbi:MAG TPA: hypothetical protein VHV29_21070 [Terriglobales bacterium]|jgi:hypothetical protein|nr:hypothetical protein [Terriglobales bacterium]
MATAQQQKESPNRTVFLDHLFRQSGLPLSKNARFVGMYLASSADWHTYETRVSYKCLLHWMKIARSTLARALGELEYQGIIEKVQRYKQSSIIRFKVDVLLANRDPYRRQENSDTDDSAPLCSQCGQEEVDVEDARCQACRNADATEAITSSKAFAVEEDLEV